MSFELEKFGKIFIEEVRDGSIDFFKKTIDGRMQGMTSQRVRSILKEIDKEQMASVVCLISEVVDQSIHNMLELVEEHPEVALLFNGVELRKISDGLSGELYTDDGWVYKYSKYPYNGI